MNFNVNFTYSFFQNKSTIFAVFKRTPAILCILNKSNNFFKKLPWPRPEKVICDI